MDTDLASYFARLSRELMHEPSTEPTMERVATRALDVVPRAQHCSISMRRRRGHVESVASTSAVALAADELQYTLEEGPCLEAIWDDEVFVGKDLTRESRWPRWCAGVHELGIGSVMAVRLATETSTLGALNLYAEEPGAFEDAQRDVAVIFATHAVNAVHSAHTVSGPRDGDGEPTPIGVAQGVLMSRYDLTLDRSFEVLRRIRPTRTCASGTWPPWSPRRGTCPTRVGCTPSAATEACPRTVRRPDRAPHAAGHPRVWSPVADSNA